MDIRKLVIVFLSLNISFTTGDFFEFKLLNLDNKTISFSDFKSNKATIIVFLLSDCPASQSYTLTLNKLAKKYDKNKVEMIGVFPGTFSTDEELRKFKSQYKINFQLVKDPEMKLAKKLNATIGPSCFLIDETGNSVYKGRIDDLLYSIGKKRQMITENNLNDAIQCVILNKPIKISETKAIGCILEYD